MSTLAKVMSSKYRGLRVSQFNVKSLSAGLKPAALRHSLKFRVCFLRVPSGGGSAAGEQRQSRQPEQSPEAGEGGCRTGQQSGAATGEEEEEEGRLTAACQQSEVLILKYNQINKPVSEDKYSCRFYLKDVSPERTALYH